jgi:uncharacterized protein (DUF169 family)
MCSAQRDYSIFHRFSFRHKPVGIKFLLNRPDGIEKLDASMAFCQMFREAQDRSPFYAARENFACMERLLLGMMEQDPIFESGQIGAKEKIYQEARANRRIYQHLPKLAKDTVRYVAFSPVDKLIFEPDVLIITAEPKQAEILLRALSYSTGKPLTTKITPVLMCAWLFFYPYVSGELNYTISGLGYGMGMRQLLPEGLVLISVPFDLIPMLMENLRQMDWVLPMMQLNEEERVELSEQIMEQIQEEYKKG